MWTSRRASATGSLGPTPAPRPWRIQLVAPSGSLSLCNPPSGRYRDVRPANQVVEGSARLTGWRSIIFRILNRPQLATTYFQQIMSSTYINTYMHTNDNAQSLTSSTRLFADIHVQPPRAAQHYPHGCLSGLFAVYRTDRRAAPLGTINIRPSAK